MKIILQLLIFIFVQNVKSENATMPEFGFPCDRQSKGTVVKFNPKNEDFKKYKEKDDAEYYKFYKDILEAKCSYDFKGRSHRFYSDVCAQIDGDVYYNVYSSDMLYYDLKHRPEPLLLHNLSQFECKEESKTYIKGIKKTATKNELDQNNFKLVENNADSKNSYLFYASPGMVIKTKKENAKCKLKDNCKLEVIYKKLISNSIFGINRNLTTEDKL